MIQLEGRVLAGLDEFMLRLGHLSVLAEVATTEGGSAYRFERALTGKLSQLVSVPDELRSHLARLLRVKGLCPVKGNHELPNSDKDAEYRYPNLCVLNPSTSEETVVALDGKLEAQWQDVQLAHPNVPSKVGAISFGGKRGSKTSLSHVIDWADLLGISSSSGSLTNFGLLVGKFSQITKQARENPYILGPERLIFAYLLIREDFDLFAVAAPILSAETGVFRKADATQLYFRTVTELSEIAEKSKDLTQGKRQKLFSLWREIRPRRPDDEISSTAWHRIASRLENFVDLGLLRKQESEQYEYKYRATESLRNAVASLGKYTDASDWIDNHLADLVLGKPSSREMLVDSSLEPVLLKLVSILARPMSPLPLDVMAAGAAALLADEGMPTSFGAARRSIENFAVQHPDRARLSSGATKKAEYISINPKNFSVRAQ